MNFIDAVKTCFRKYADFNGCASRPEFWWWVLFTVLASMALRIVSYDLVRLFSIATLLPGIAVTARRLHDTDRADGFNFCGSSRWSDGSSSSSGAQRPASRVDTAARHLGPRRPRAVVNAAGSTIHIGIKRRLGIGDPPRPKRLILKR